MITRHPQHLTIPQNAQLRVEREILKKAAAFFAREQP